MPMATPTQRPQDAGMYSHSSSTCAPVHSSVAVVGVAATTSPSDLPTVTMLNPRHLANSYEKPPPVSAHAHYQHVLRTKMRAGSSGYAGAGGVEPLHTAPSMKTPSPSPAAPQPLVKDSPIPPELTSLLPPTTEREQRTPDPAHLQQEVLRLQAENASVLEELQALKARLKALELQGVVGAPPSTQPEVNLSSIQSEHQALAALQQSQATDMPLPLMKHVHAFDAEPFLRPVGTAQLLHNDITNMLDHLKPNKRSESRRANVLAFLKLLVRKSLGAMVYPLGGYALKTYIGQDEAMDVSAFFSRAHENTWLHRIVNALCQEASSNHHNATNALATNTTSPHYAVTKLSVSFNRTMPYIHCCIGSIHVNIYGNHVPGLSSLALFERADLMCGQEHLLKRTILLVKCWCMAKKILNCASTTITPSSSGDDLFSHVPIEGLLSGIFVRTLVLYIFNAHAADITTPLEGLYRLLEYFKDFDWNEHALTVYGAVTLASLEQYGPHAHSKLEFVQTGPTAWPTHRKPFLPRETWQQYVLVPKETSRGSSRQGTTSRPPSSTVSLQSSPVLASTLRSNSDSHLPSLPTRTIAPMAAHVHSRSNIASPIKQPIQSPARSNLPNFPPPLHSHSYTALNELDATTQTNLRSSMHSHSFSNLSNLSPKYPADSQGLTPDLTPSQSQQDLQKLAIVRMGFGSSNTLSHLAHQQQQPTLQAAMSHSSPFFSRTLDHEGYSSDSPDVDDDETMRRTHCYDSLDGGDDTYLEGAEYLDIGDSKPTSPTGGNEDDLLAYPDVPSPGPNTAPVNDTVLFHRCALNVLDPVDPTHNLGASISYKHEYHIRQVFRDGFLAIKNSLQRYAFQHASSPMAGDTQPKDGAEVPVTPTRISEFAAHPVMTEIFEEAQLARYKENQHREQKHRKLMAAQQQSPSIAATPAAGATAAPWSMPAPRTMEQVFQQAPGPFSAAAFSISTAAEVESQPADLSASQGSLFAFDTPAASVTRTLSGHSIVSLNPHSGHYVPTTIVDDTPSSSSLTSTANSTHSGTSASAGVASTVATPAPAAAFDSLSGDFDRIVANLDHARQFETPDLTEDQLVHLIIDLLKERVSVPVGRMGSMLHDATNNHSLPAMLKETFGGLKRLLERHADIFQVGRDHPYNPNVSLRPKWFNFAPPRPNMASALGNAGNAHALGTSPNGMTSQGSGTNLQGLTNGDGNNRRKLQRRRTRTRRTNSGASAAASASAAQAVRSGTDQAVAAAVHYPRAMVTPIVALDCEMVGVGASGLASMLARITIVNFGGEVLYDKYVAPTETVTDYRTSVSGILPHHLESGHAHDFRQVQREVSQILKGRVIVGHGLTADLQALCIAIPKAQLRDTAAFKLFCPQRPLTLKQLVNEHLAPSSSGWASFQEHQHDPVQDARAALALYKLVQQAWEMMVVQEAQSQQQQAHPGHAMLAHAHHSNSSPAITSLGANFAPREHHLPHHSQQYQHAPSMHQHQHAPQPQAVPHSQLHSPSGLLSHSASPHSHSPSQFSYSSTQLTHSPHSQLAHAHLHLRRSPATHHPAYQQQQQPPSYLYETASAHLRPLNSHPSQQQYTDQQRF